jgi:hypothetical protein
MAILATLHSDPNDVTWTHPEDGLWIATLSSHFYGQVRERTRTLAVFDANGRRVGRYYNLARAMNALLRQEHLSVRGILRRDFLAQTAVLLGLLAAALAAVALPVYFR